MLQMVEWLETHALLPLLAGCTELLPTGNPDHVSQQ